MSQMVVFGRRGCPYTEAALEKLSNEGTKHIFIEVPKCPDENMCKLFRMMAQEQGHRTVPCIFEVKYIGGFSDL